MRDYLYSPASLSEQTKNMAEAIRYIATCRNMAEARLTELEQEQSAIYHEMERPRCLYRNRARLATRLQQVLRERREIKDWMSANKSLFTFADSDKYTNILRLMEAFQGETNKAAKRERQIQHGVDVEAMEGNA